MGIVAREVSGTAAHDQRREAGAGTVVCKGVGGREDPLPDFKPQLYQHHLQDRPPCLSVPQFLHPWVGDGSEHPPHLGRVLQSAPYPALWPILTE